MEGVTVRRMQQRLGEVKEEFKRFHFTIIDLLEQKWEIELEQGNFDEHENRIADPIQKGLNRRQTLLDTELRDIAGAVEAMEKGPELHRCLLEQHEEQISGLKSELTDVSRIIATLEEDKTGLKDRRTAISKAIFNTCLQIRQLLSDRPATPLTKEAKIGIKLPKMNVPTFDGNILIGTPFGSNLTW